jgi:hypothetical protein
MANEARKEAVNTPNLKYNEAAKRVYAGEVKSLDAKLDIALRNAPVEREAQRLANATVALKRQANPGMEASDLKKIKNQALAEARTRTGAGKTRVQIEPSEWEAIQAGAISNNKMKKILANADIDVLRKLATPRTPTVMTSAAQSRAKLMLTTGYTQAQVAAQLGVGLSTLKSYISEEGL